MMNDTQLSQYLAKKIITPLRFADRVWLADALGALYCPDEDLLLVSDLHFGKGSYLKLHGSPIPCYDTHKTLAMLTELIHRYRPQTCVCLGDSFHDLGAGQRFSSSEVEQLNTLVGQVPQWIWVLGNHDPAIPDGIRGKSIAHWQLGECLLTHEPENISHFGCTAQIIGHFHPKATCTVKRHSMTGKVFLLDTTCLIMPSLGAFTGGLDADDPAFLSLFAASPQQLLCYQNKIYPIKQA